MKFGVVGLGRMGGGLALHALEQGHEVVGYAVGGASDQLVAAGLKNVTGYDALVSALPRRRVILLYIPAGKAVDDALSRLLPLLARDDIIVDGGNSYWRESIARSARVAEAGVHFIDAGMSGGVEGARHGACFMLGGNASAVAYIRPLLEGLAVPGGFVHAGGPGAGHFTKLVHNGIEFGMLQAIGEGVALLEGYKEALPIADVLACWRHGSVIRSWLIDLMESGYRAHPGLGDIPSYVDDTGEVNWLVGDALDLDVSVPVIAQAVMQLLQSRDGRQAASRAIAVMRNGFGGHAFGRSPSAATERKSGRSK
jgi:6-phosphogluconate dehydrogenase